MAAFAASLEAAFAIGLLLAVVMNIVATIREGRSQKAADRAHADRINSPANLQRKADAKAAWAAFRASREANGRDSAQLFDAYKAAVRAVAY